ncbi:Fructosamine/Ketosamine-3-kinase [Podospora fimiseda]|uniref:protein-ribulosamine 3-kinase n=1 Tax=Podospora fimiseda TaxID=252190 RepID=A0AAN6YNW4_9PEZI|nr:Fructosamine/Ketosamine-3-kinase [Podospora fimiseda]
MIPNIPPNLLSALGNLPPSSSKLISHSTSSGHGVAGTYKLISTKDGQSLTFFIKTGSTAASEVMFKGEYHSLNAIHSVLPNFCPKAHAHGSLGTGSTTVGSMSGNYFLATDFLEFNASGSEGSGMPLSQKLAKLHTTPAPLVNGKKVFGFPVPTCCGATVQDNTWKERWDEFYADNRLRGILKECIKNNGGGKDEELSGMVEVTAGKVVPRLLGGMEIEPVVVHGDLWSGNRGRARILGADQGHGHGVEEVVYDAACVYGHSEYELGIMRMFGGFGNSFWKEYEKLVPKAEPVGEWEDRVRLYELYHHLNHYALFGGSYRSSAMSIMRKLNSKYS